jgi:hypothetical protein
MNPLDKGALPIELICEAQGKVACFCATHATFPINGAI